MATALRCPRCRATVQAHWTRCPTCGFEPSAPARPSAPVATAVAPIGGAGRTDDPDDGAAAPRGAAGAEPPSDGPDPAEQPVSIDGFEGFDAFVTLEERRTVHDPEADDPGPHPALVVALASVAAVLVGLILVGILLDDDGSGGGAATGPVALGRTAEERSTTDLGDGWWRLELDDGALAVDLPGPLLLTRDELQVEDQLTPMPAAVWAGGSGTEEVYGVVVAEPPSSWGRTPEELLEDVSLTVADREVGGSGVPTEVAGRPALRRFAGGGGSTTATTSVATDDAIVILVLRGDPAVLDDALERMESTLQLG